MPLLETHQPEFSYVFLDGIPLMNPAARGYHPHRPAPCGAAHSLHVDPIETAVGLFTSPKQWYLDLLSSLFCSFDQPTKKTAPRRFIPPAEDPGQHPHPEQLPADPVRRAGDPVRVRARGEGMKALGEGGGQELA